MTTSTMLVLCGAAVTTASIWNGWRDQYVRVSPQIAQGVKTMRRRLTARYGPGTDFPDSIKQAAKDAMRAAERVSYATQSGRNDGRKLMDVTNNESSRVSVVNGVTIPDMSLWDCPWAASLHPYLDVNRAFAVDGGLCLPYQEVPFPYQMGGATPVDFDAAGIVCPHGGPGGGWDITGGNTGLPYCTDAAGNPTGCLYGNETTASGLGENYGCAAVNAGWVDLAGNLVSDADQLETPICTKTYVEDCKYSTEKTRKYEYGTEAATDPASLGGGWDINWVLHAVSGIRNNINGLSNMMEQDLGLPVSSPEAPFFPTNLYYGLYGLPSTAVPPTEGKYPHAYTKGEFDASATVEADKDGKCTKRDSMSQWMDCGIPCPVGDDARMEASDMGGFQAAVLSFMFLCAIIGAGAFLFVGKDSTKFFVGGRNLNVFVVTATLASQSLDSNAALGNIDLGYFYHWWDGACLPLGLGLSLVLNGIFFAKPLNEMQLLTLPDVFARKFGPATEVLFSILAIVSFLFLLGGNLVGSGRIIAYLFGLDPIPGIWITTFAIWLYTIAGGLISVAYTDCAQALIGWLGLIVGAGWCINNLPGAPGRGPAYPNGDEPAFGEQMNDPNALDPIPNAIHFNWITIFVLGFGNLAALDFQARVFGARTPKVAMIGCILGGIISWIVGITFSFTSGSARALYGPSSPYAEFVADSCSKEITIIGCFGGPDTGFFDGTGPATAPSWRGPGCGATVLNGVPTCGEWKPDPYAALRMFTCTKEKCHYILDFDGSYGVGTLQDDYFPMNGFIGGWVLVAIVAASMSTGDGAILAMSTVWSHNVMRKLPIAFFQDEANLLKAARMFTVIWAPIAAGIASSAPDSSGYFLIVAFDIMLAGSVVPLFAAVYWKGCKPFAAFMAMLLGSLCRLVLEFALPKDYLLLLVGKYAISFGPGAYGGLDLVTGAPHGGWCPQYDLADWTGIDSLISPFVSLFVLLLFQLLPSPATPSFTPVEPPEQETKTTAESTSSSSSSSSASSSAA